MVKVTILVVLLTTSLCISFFNLAKMPTDNGARCLDGSPYGIYVCEPDSEDVPVIANKLLIVW